MGITTIAFFNVVRRRSNVLKFWDGGYVPILLAFVIFGAMRTWKRGRELLARHFARASLHERVILVTVTTLKATRVLERRFEFAELPEGICRLHVYSGFMETPDVPRALSAAIAEYGLAAQADDITYFLGRETLLAMRAGEMGVTRRCSLHSSAGTPRTPRAISGFRPSASWKSRCKSIFDRSAGRIAVLIMITSATLARARPAPGSGRRE